jgi:hypothetical protein
VEGDADIRFEFTLNLALVCVIYCRTTHASVISLNTMDNERIDA